LFAASRFTRTPRSRASARRRSRRVRDGRADAPKKLDDEAATWIARAIANANATDLDYDAFTALVIAYLEPAHASIYSSRVWEAMQ
jgi:hypothetical protein